jgi:hypothetical protein
MFYDLALPYLESESDRRALVVAAMDRECHVFFLSLCMTNCKLHCGCPDRLLVFFRVKRARVFFVFF